MQNLIANLGYWVRLMAKAPGFNLLAVAALACAVAARRATQVDPLEALRAEG